MGNARKEDLACYFILKRKWEKEMGSTHSNTFSVFHSSSELTEFDVPI
jgi:prolyl-tRNA synthetase